jgi:hypothetical protein
VSPEPQAKAAVKAVHELNEQESAMLQGINQQALQVKAQLFDLDRQREALSAQLDQAQRHFNGAVASLGASHGIDNAIVTPDFKRIIRGGQQV